MIVNQNDLPTCNGITQRGKKCKNKQCTGSLYCKRHVCKFRLEKPEECPVCMESLQDVVVPLSCSHWVHPKCIVNWGKETCPLCRQHIFLPLHQRNQMRKIRDKGKMDEIRREIRENELDEDFIEILSISL